jgi:septal ring factor EnvC (AmiA/AmiB activator)
MALRSARALLLLAASAAALAPLAQAQPRAELSRVERQRAEASAQATRLQREARTAQREVTALTARAAEARRRKAELDAAKAETEARLAALHEQEESETELLAKDRRNLENLLIAAAFAERRGDRASVQTRMFAGAAAPLVTWRVRASRTAIASARQEQDLAAAERITLAQSALMASAEAEGAQIRLAQQRAVHAALRADAAEAQARARQVAREARTLRELASRVTQPRRSTPGAGAGSATASAATVALPTNWLAPTQGRIVRGFGSREGAGPVAQGATLRASAGAAVVAPAAGEIAYAGVFRSYGQVLILNLDNGYALVLTGMDTLRARTGERVAAGQTIGAMSSSDTPAPELYVEVRRNGQPVNPARWLTARGITLASAG